MQAICLHIIPQQQVDIHLSEPDICIGINEVYFSAIMDYIISDEYIYILDYVAPFISVFDSDGQLIKQFGKQGQGPGEFIRPTRINRPTALATHQTVCLGDRSLGVDSGAGDV